MNQALRYGPVLVLLCIPVVVASSHAAAREPGPVEGLEGAAASQASASAAPPAPPTAISYRIDARASQFFVEAEAAGVLAVFGHNHKFQVRDFAGTVNVPANGLASASLDLAIVADSLTLVDKVSDDDRKEIEGSTRQKVLETSRFPKILFRTTGVTVTGSSDASTRLGIVGDLWLHGVGHSVTIPVALVQRGDSLRATGAVTIRQTDYGMTPIAAVAGTVRVKDEVTISFDIVGTRS